jgi:hypothetical protein
MGISAQVIDIWRQQLSDSGQVPGITSSDHAKWRRRGNQRGRQ